MVSESSLPKVVVNMTTDDMQSYDLRCTADMRHILFTGEDKNELDILFADNVKIFFTRCVEEFQENPPPAIERSDLLAGLMSSDEEAVESEENGNGETENQQALQGAP